MYYKRGKGDMTRVCRINLNALIASFLKYIDQYCLSSGVEFVSVRSKPEEPAKIQGLAEIKDGTYDNTSHVIFLRLSTDFGLQRPKRCRFTDWKIPQ